MPLNPNSNCTGILSQTEENIFIRRTDQVEGELDMMCPPHVKKWNLVVGQGKELPFLRFRKSLMTQREQLLVRE